MPMNNQINSEHQNLQKSVIIPNNKHNHFKPHRTKNKSVNYMEKSQQTIIFPSSSNQRTTEHRDKME